MAGMVRKQIYIGAAQERVLKREAKRQGVSEAELIRRALDSAVSRPLWGGDDPRAGRSFLRFARQRMRKRRSSGARSWSREDLYERGRARAKNLSR